MARNFKFPCLGVYFQLVGRDCLTHSQTFGHPLAVWFGYPVFRSHDGLAFRKAPQNPEAVLTFFKFHICTLKIREMHPFRPGERWIIYESEPEPEEEESEPTTHSDEDELAKGEARVRMFEEFMDRLERDLREERVSWEEVLGSVSWMQIQARRFLIFLRLTDVLTK